MLNDNPQTNSNNESSNWVFYTRLFFMIGHSIAGVLLILWTYLPAPWLNFFLGFVACLVAVLALSTIWGLMVAYLLTVRYEKQV